MNPKKNRNICKFCGKECVKRNNIFCDTSCEHKYKSKILLENWLSGEDVYTSATRWMRDFLIDWFKGKCAVCGWCETNPVTGNSPLEVHHVDGDSENNEFTNLILLCPNCHSLTSNYKALNKGNGRRFR